MKYSQRFTQHKLELLVLPSAYMPLARAPALCSKLRARRNLPQKIICTTRIHRNVTHTKLYGPPHPLAGTQLSVQHLAAALFLRAA